MRAVSLSKVSISSTGEFLREVFQDWDSVSTNGFWYDQSLFPWPDSKYSSTFFLKSSIISRCSGLQLARRSASRAASACANSSNSAGVGDGILRGEASDFNPLKMILQQIQDRTEHVYLVH